MAIGRCGTTVYITNKECDECDQFEQRLQTVENTLPNKQNKLVAGDNITINGNTISAAGFNPGFQCTEEITELFNGAVTTVSNQAGTYGTISNDISITADTLLVTFEGEEYSLQRKYQGDVPCYGESNEGTGSDPFIYDTIPFGIRNNGDNSWYLFTPEAGTYSLYLADYDANVNVTECFKAAVNSVKGRQEIELFRELPMSVNPWSSGDCVVDGASEYLIYIVIQRYTNGTNNYDDSLIVTRNTDNGYLYGSLLTGSVNNLNQTSRTFSAIAHGDVWTMRFANQLLHTASSTHDAGQNCSIVKIIGAIPKNISTLVADLTVDDTLSDQSENPVQNKVIAEAIGDVESLLAAI